MVYLDFNATTPLDPRVELAMSELPSFIANPGSIQHYSGMQAKNLLEESRESVANSLGASSQEIIFTSGSSEGVSLSVLGISPQLVRQSTGILVVTTEHKAVLNAASMARKLFNVNIDYVGVNQQGLIDLNELDSQLRTGKFSFLAVMHSNNETGVVQDIRAIAEMAKEHGVLIFCDLTQSIGKIPVSEILTLVDFAVMSAHKFYGPKGIGVLYAKRDAQKVLDSLVPGGGQERGLRGGTPNVPGAFGLAKSLEFSMEDMETNSSKYAVLSHRFISNLIDLKINFEQIGEFAPRLSNTLNLRFNGYEADSLMANMPDVEVSTGSACNSAVVEPSHVLLAHGIGVLAANECIRFSFGISTTPEEIDFTCRRLAEAMSRIEQKSLATAK